jgi:hypothetical protein
MRQITRKIVDAFESRNSLTIDNSRTDGQSLWLFGNRIAEWRSDGLWISNGGWDSKTTKERLNGLRGVMIHQIRGEWFLNGRLWDGSWVHVGSWADGSGRITPQPLQVANEPEFDVTSEWLDEGYSKPNYSVFHTWIKSNIAQVEAILNREGIPTKEMESDTDGVYRPNYFVVVRPEDFDNAVNILSITFNN